MSTFLDTYPDSNKGLTYSSYAGSNVKISQSFTCNASGRSLVSAAFVVLKAGTPPGTIQYSLYAHSGTYGTSSVPTGAPLSTSATYTASSLGTSTTNLTLTFPTPYALTNGANYCIVFEYSGGDSSNYVKVWYDDAAPTHSGNAATSNDGSTYTALSGSDMCFYLRSVITGTTLIDDYASDNNSVNISIAPTAFWRGQSFTWSQSGMPLTSVDFMLRKLGSPTGNAYATLYAHSGTFGASSIGTGSPLATSQPLDVSTLSTDLTIYEIPFTDGFVPTNGTYYVIGIQYAAPDASNCIYIGRDTTSSTHAGNMCALSSAPTWTYSATYDVPFYVYGTAPSTSQKSVCGVTRANVKSVHGVALASIKSINWVA